MQHLVSGVRVLFAGQYWPGANTLYIARAFENCGAIVRILNESSIYPAEWWSLPARLVRRALGPLIRYEWNRQMREMVKEFRPDLVYLSNAGFADLSTLREIRASGIPILCFYHDVSWNRPGDDFIDKVGMFDLVSTTRRWQEPLLWKAGARQVKIVRFAYDDWAHRPLALTLRAREPYEADISFIATCEPHRARELERLVSSAFPYRFRLWGGYWDRLGKDSPLQNYWQKRVVHEQEIPVIYAATKIALHWVGHEPEGDDPMLRLGDQHNSRTFQIPACGGALMMAQRTEEHLRFFKEDEEAVYFGDVDELKEKLAYWIDPSRDERRRAIVNAARDRCVKEDYTYVPVVAEYLMHFGLSSTRPV